MPATTPAPLSFRATELTATSHRGVYRVQVRPSWAYAYFAPFVGGSYDMLPSAHGKHAVRRVTAACAEHAAAQPAHPPMLGWPADGGDLEAVRALEACHG